MEPRLLLEATPLITEFMADNGQAWYPADPDSDWDWIEIYNPTPSTISLTGWHLTDDPESLSKWTFPTRTLGSEQYLLVFASGLEGGDPAHPGDLHADFKLSSDGEYVALVRPGGDPNDVVSEYYFGEQLEDVSYGAIYDVVNQADLVVKGDDATYLVPTDSALGLTWTGNGFDDSVWTLSLIHISEPTRPY